MPCCYLPEIDSKENTFVIQGEEFHHLSQVVRKREGEEILVTSGTGILAKCLILEIERKLMIIEIKSKEYYKRSTPQMALGFALLKNKHDNMIIEKVTELGCSSFYPLETERTVRHISDNLISKLHKVAISAIKQCDNAWLPEINECYNLREIPSRMKEDGYLPVVALETENTVNLQELKRIYPDRSMGIIIGPEGGFTKTEIEFFKEEQIATFSLGNHTLRAETAAITAISQLAGINLYSDKNYY